jgi:uncharacterized protein (TIGR03437 family)
MRGDTVVSNGAARIAAVAPGLFAANADGKGVAAAVMVRVGPDGTQSADLVFRCTAGAGTCVSAPVDAAGAGDTCVLLLFGTGLARRSSLGAVSVTVGGMPATVQYAGRQGEYAGLDQVNALLPGGMSGRGEVDVILTVDGQAANAVKVNIK